MVEIVVLSKSEFEEVLQQTAILAASAILEKINKPISEIMTKTELTEYLRCSVSKVNYLMKKDLPHFMFGDTPRFRKSQIDVWLDTKSTNSK